jgi:hypothetical protein
VLKTLQDTNEFISGEITSLKVFECMQEVDDDFFSDGHYFELISESLPPQMHDIACICSKTYYNGVCFVTFYFEGTFYAVVLDATQEDQALRDVSMPDITQGGEGFTLKYYDGHECFSVSDEDLNAVIWKKLSLWQTLGIPAVEKDLEDTSTISLSSSSYGQSYIILKPNKPDPSSREVLFVFGSWAYSGELELLPELSFEDVEHIIPALRSQQHRLLFLCHTTEMPTDSIYTAPLEYLTHIGNLAEQEIMKVSAAIEALQVDDEDPETFLFEFETVPQSRTILDQCQVDCIATKSYRASGVIVMTVYFRGTFYVSLSSGGNDVGLLDSKFPSIVQEQSYKIKTYPSGITGWKELRKQSLIRNVKYERTPVSDANDDLAAEEKTHEPKHLASEEGHKHKISHPDDGTCMENEFEAKAEPKTHGISTCKEHEASNGCQSINLDCHQETALEDRKFDNQETVNNNFASSRNSCRRRKPCRSLGGVHRLAPLKKSSLLQKNRTLTEDDAGNSVAWNTDGRPTIQNL